MRYQVDPYFPLGYTMPANFYVHHGRIDEARAEFEGIVRRDPSNISARTTFGILLEMQGKRRRQEILRSDGQRQRQRAGRGQQSRVHLRGAGDESGPRPPTCHVSQGEESRRPSVDDTIGWIYYKKDLPSLAVGPLEDSIRKRPGSPEVLFHPWVDLGQSR